MMERRFYSLLEGIRGVAAILVVLRHISHLVWPLDFPVSGLAVDLFFVLSGVVIANSYEQRLLSGNMTFKSFVRARIERIHPLYMLASLLGLATLVASHALVAWQILPVTILAAVMLPVLLGKLALYPLNHPAWSLFFEYIANFSYAAGIRRASTRNLIIVIGACWIGLMAYTIYFGTPLEQIGWSRRTFPLGVFRVGGSFFLGVILFRLLHTRPPAKPLGNTWAWTVIAVVSGLLMAQVPRDLEAVYCYVTAFVLFPVLVAIALFVQPLGLTDKLMRTLGEISFPLYVLHVPVYQLIDWLAGGKVSPHSPWLGLVFVAAMIPISLAANRWVDAPVRAQVRSFLNSSNRA